VASIQLQAQKSAPFPHWLVYSPCWTVFLILAFISAPFPLLLLHASALLCNFVLSIYFDTESSLACNRNIMSGSTVSARSSAEEPASSASQHQQPRKLTALERNNLEWESRKEEIHNVYIGQDKTLKETMQWFKETRGLDWRYFTLALLLIALST